MITASIRLQEDIYFGLLSSDLFAAFNIVQYRKMRVQSEIDFSTIWLTSRANNKSGIGILLEMPTVSVNNAYLPGPQKCLTFSAVVLEQPTINMGDTGTQVSAEDLAELLLDFLHHWIIDASGNLLAEKVAIKPADEFREVVAYRVRFTVIRSPEVIQRVDCPTLTSPAQTFSIANGANTPTAAIYYTLDDSFPGPGNPAAHLYAAPVTVPSGTWVRLAAYVAGLLPSTVPRIKIT